MLYIKLYYINIIQDILYTIPLCPHYILLSSCMAGYTTKAGDHKIGHISVFFHWIYRREPSVADPFILEMMINHEIFGTLSLQTKPFEQKTVTAPILGI